MNASLNSLQNVFYRHGVSREFAFSESNKVNAKVTNVILFCRLYSQEKIVLLFLKLFIFVRKK